MTSVTYIYTVQVKSQVYNDYVVLTLPAPTLRLSWEIDDT